MTRPGAAPLAEDVPAALPQPSVTSLSKLLSFPCSLGHPRPRLHQHLSAAISPSSANRTARRGSSGNQQHSLLRGTQRRSPPKPRQSPRTPGAASHAWPVPLGLTSVHSAGSQHFPEHPQRAREPLNPSREMSCRLPRATVPPPLVPGQRTDGPAAQTRSGSHASEQWHFC